MLTTMQPKLSLFLRHCLLLLFSTFAQGHYPTVSCPDVFKYSYDPQSWGHYGLVIVQKDSLPISELQINMTTNTQHYLHNKLQIIVLSSTQEFFNNNGILKYAVLFPTQDIIPKLTSLQYNGRTLCFGMTDPLAPGLIQTHLWAKSLVTTYGPVQTGTVYPFDFQIPQQVLSTPQTPLQLSDNPFIPVTLADNPVATPDYQSLVPTPNETATPELAHQCGIVADVQGLIVKGEEVAPGDFPWLAAIMYKKGTDYKFHCTGNLISSEHILTAGHCVNNSNTPVNDYDDLIIILGKLSMNNWARDATVRHARAITTHPNYKDNSAASDIAIIVLREPVTFQPTVRPICLWKGDDDLEEIVGKLGTVVGWAPNKPTGEVNSMVAQKVKMPVVSQEQCLRSNKVFQRFTSSGTFCAGNRDNSGPCMGDSGAGFAIKDDSTRRWFLRGLVGLSIRDPLSLSCDLSHFVIFTDVAKIRLWIYQEMQKHQRK